MKRPWAISLIAGYSVAVGCLPLSVSIKLFIDNQVTTLAAGIQLLPALTLFLVGFGLWRLLRWGLWLAVAYYTLDLILAFPDFLDVIRCPDADYMAYTVLVMLQATISMAVLLVLLRPEVRRLFGVK